MASQGPRSRYAHAQAGLEEAKRRAVQSREMARAYIEQYPMPTVLIAFGLGVGVGVWVGSQLIPMALVPEATLAEKVGRQILGVLGNVLPEQVVSRLHV